MVPVLSLRGAIRSQAIPYEYIANQEISEKGLFPSKHDWRLLNCHIAHGQLSEIVTAIVRALGIYEDMIPYNEHCQDLRRKGHTATNTRIDQISPIYPTGVLVDSVRLAD